MAIQLINSANSIEVYNTTSTYKETWPKGSFRTFLRGDVVTMVSRSTTPTAPQKSYIELRYADITVPTGLTSAALVYALIISWDAESAAGAGIADAGFYIGKPTNGDFTTAYLAATTITLSDLPPGISTITDEDIEMVRQINVAGDEVDVFFRGDVRMTVAANVLTVTGATFTATDTFVVYTNIPRASSSASGGTTTEWSNAKGDFTAEISNATKQITITGLPFTLEWWHVKNGSISRKDSSNNVTDVIITSIGVAGGVITLADEASNFVTGDEVTVNLDGPTKNRDADLDSEKSSNQNPNHFHYTDPETLISESAFPGLTAYVDDGAGDATTIIDATAAFTAAAIASVIGYKVWSITDGTYGLVASWTDGTTIVTSGGTIVSWASDAFKIPVAEYKEFSAESFNFLALHYRLSADLNTAYTLKIYGTLDASAVVGVDDKWADLSLDILGAASIVADGITAGATELKEDIVYVDTASPMLKYMVKIVAEGDVAAASGSSAEVFIKKSS